MKLSNILPLVAVSSAFVVPSEQVLREIEIEDAKVDCGNTENSDLASKIKDFFSSAQDHFEKYVDQAKDVSEDAWAEIAESSTNAVDQAFDYGSDAANAIGDKLRETGSNTKDWMDAEYDDLYETLDGGHHGPPHPKPGHGKRPHKPHEPSNKTVYQLIAESKYTTKLAELVSEYDDLVKALNSTKGNYTVFAPTDKAFAKIPKHAPKPSKEQLKDILSYHVLPGLYPAKRVLGTHTAPTLLLSDSLGAEPLPQRLHFRVSFKGLTAGWYSKIIALNIFAKNGIIHGVDSIILPPPSVITQVDLFPGTFSTLELGLGKTELLDQLNTTDHAGGTFFAPTNYAFKKLGPRINAFLFSQYGLKYLKALLEYHVVPKNTLYSDAYYKSESSDADIETTKGGYSHINLPTLLKDRELSIDIARYGPFIEIKINGFARVDVKDVVAEDGVIQVLANVLIPPKKVGDAEEEHWDGETEMSVEEFKERFDPYMPKSDL